jgi:hypothetical protein
MQVNGDLQAALDRRMQSGSWSDPALTTLLDDYTKYHVVLVVAGSLLATAFMLLSVFFWTRLRNAPKAGKGGWTFEQCTCFSFGSSSAAVCALIVLLSAVNATNALDPKHGFSLLVDSLATPNPGTQMARLHQAFATWVQSGTTTMPPLVQEKVHERVAFHATRAAVSGLLFMTFVVLSTGIWMTLVRRSRVGRGWWGLKEGMLLASGVAAVAFALLLMVIVVANLQGALAPITMTLAYG